MNLVKRLSLASLAVLVAFPVFAANGSLKVTSFPSGAQVWLDGVDTGKLTPMSISLADRGDWRPPVTAASRQRPAIRGCPRNPCDWT